MIILMFLLWIAIFVFFIISYWRVYEKAGKPGWGCIIPVYNTLLLLEMAGKPWWWIFLLLIPIVNIVIIIMVWHQISLAFGKDGGFTAGLILLPLVFIPILAFGDAKYKGQQASNRDRGPLDQV